MNERCHQPLNCYRAFAVLVALTLAILMIFPASLSGVAFGIFGIDSKTQNFAHIVPVSVGAMLFKIIISLIELGFEESNLFLTYVNIEGQK